MSKQSYNAEDIWESFFNDPVLKRIIEEAGGENIDSDDDPELAEADPEEAPEGEDPEGGAAPAPEGEGEGEFDLEQLSADFQEGKLDQDDLIKLYQSGKITKEEIQQIIEAAENGQEPQSEEELLSQQIDQTNDMFVKFALYDKITELSEKLGYFKDNFDDTRSEMYERVLQLSEFLNILSSLIFSIETSVSYQMYGSILLQLTELFEEYRKKQDLEQAQEDMEDHQIKKQKKAKHEVDLNDNFEDADSDEKIYSDQDKGQGHIREMRPVNP